MIFLKRLTLLITILFCENYNAKAFEALRLNLFKLYMAERKLFTKINNSLSCLKPIKTTVPQGSVLGPLLFLKFINDIKYCVSDCNVIYYADDTTLYFTSYRCNEI